MSFWKPLLLNCYYYGSYPQRAWRNAQLRTRGRSPVMVLFYHRISDDRANAWTTSNFTFEKQIRWLKGNFELVSLSEAQHRVRVGHNDRPCVAITFDDGYADNCRRALPLLIAEKIPCTYFVSSQFVIDGVPFSHDVANKRPLAPNTPQQIQELALAGIDIAAHTRTHADLGPTTDPDRLVEELAGARHELQELTGTPIRYFSFPYGQHVNLSPAAFQLAQSAGYDGVCSAYGGYNFPGDDPFHLQRIPANGDLIRLKNWTTVDPRKLRSVRRYEYQCQPFAPSSGVSA
ncbi:MAG: polysaccharide deacetylase family protein [Planctomycetia bacterium]|nr:polysaccharide deacetylase family protein [Planctomycetia bacterium]